MKNILKNNIKVVSVILAGLTVGIMVEKEGNFMSSKINKEENTKVETNNIKEETRDNEEVVDIVEKEEDIVEKEEDIVINREDVFFELREEETEVKFIFTNNSKYVINYVDCKTKKGDFIISDRVIQGETRTLTIFKDSGEKQKIKSVTLRAISKDKTQSKIVTFYE